MSVNFTADDIRKLMQHLNDQAHEAVSRGFIFLGAVQKPSDKSKFVIVADSVYEKALEGVELTFADPKDFIRLFPELAGNPTHLPPNTEIDQKTGKVQGKHKDPYLIKEVDDGRQNEMSSSIEAEKFPASNAVDGDLNTKWAIKKMGATLTLDVGSVQPLGAVSIAWGNGNERQFKFNLFTSEDKTNWIPTFDNDKFSSGKTSGFESYNLKENTTARYVKVVVNGNTANGDWAVINEMKVLRARVINPAEVDVVVPGRDNVLDTGATDKPVEVVKDGDNTQPPVEGEPVNPNKGRHQPEKGGNTDANTWQVIPMKYTDGKYKIIDPIGINVYDNFDTEKDAIDTKNYWVWFQKTNPPKPVESHPPIEEPPITDQPKPTGSIQLIYPQKQGGQVVSKTTYERSTHNQSNKKNIPRDSFYSDPKSYFTAANAQIAGYFNVDFNVDDELSFKILGGGHSDDNPKEGRCYAIGVHIYPGKASGVHVAKEYPQHSETPKFYKEAILSGQIQTMPDLNNKTFGMRLNYWVTKKNTLAGRVDLDLSVLDKKVSDLTECPNQWKTYFTFEDDGGWAGEPYTSNQGVLFKGKKMGFYVRIDDIGKKTETAFLQGVETQPVLA